MASLAVGGTTTFTIVVNVPAGTDLRHGITNSANGRLNTMIAIPNNNTGFRHHHVRVYAEQSQCHEPATPIRCTRQERHFRIYVTNAGPAAGTTVTYRLDSTGTTFVVAR